MLRRISQLQSDQVMHLCFSPPTSTLNPKPFSTVILPWLHSIASDAIIIITTFPRFCCCKNGDDGVRLLHQSVPFSHLTPFLTSIAPNPVSRCQCFPFSAGSTPQRMHAGSLTDVGGANLSAATLPMEAKPGVCMTPSQTSATLRWNARAPRRISDAFQGRVPQTML